MDETKKIKIVVVDDELSVQREIRKILVSKGCVLSKIKEIVGKNRFFVALKYQDEDGDEVTAITEEEATMAVFEESITHLKVD